jgi:hypothetical protein
MMVTECGVLLQSVGRLLNDLVPVLANTIVFTAALGWFVSRRADAATSLESGRAYRIRAGHATLMSSRRETRR